MEDAEVTNALVAVHKEIQGDLGHDEMDVTPSTCPLTGLTGFDSPLIPNAVRMVAQLLGVKLPRGAKMRNIYVSPDGKRKLTIAEIAGRFKRLYALEAVAA